MADGGHSMSELDNGNSVSPASDHILPHSKTSTDELLLPRRPEELRRSSSEHTAPCSQRDPRSGHPEPGQGTQLPIPPQTPDQGNAAHPHSMAESPDAAHQQENSIANHGSHDSGGVSSTSGESEDLRGLDLPRLPVQRSHSDTLHMLRKAPAPPPHSETSCPSYPGRGDLLQDAFHTLACNQPMQLGACNPARNGCVRVWAADPAKTASEIDGEDQNPRSCEEPMKCYCTFANPHGTLEDTFAAYCHPEPISSPAQLTPRLLGTEAVFRDQRALPPHPAPTLLSLPRLMSSVSETGLDAKRLLQCCKLNCNVSCSWANALPPTVAMQKYMQDYSCVSSNNRATKDTGTMTKHTKLRDVGVQTGQTLEMEPTHVYPQVCLVEENRDSDGNTSEVDTSQKLLVKEVKEVKWDAEGMTWEVYGASVDPEELGLAIQKHLELQIKETAGRAAKLSHDNTTTSRKSSGGADAKRKKGGVVGSIRTPACCAFSSTAVD